MSHKIFLSCNFQKITVKSDVVSRNYEVISRNITRLKKEKHKPASVNCFVLICLFVWLFFCVFVFLLFVCCCCCFLENPKSDTMIH